MDTDNKTKQFFKILFGAAWIDGNINPEERNYLHCMATNMGIADDPEIKSLLAEIKPIKPKECYQWLEDYLGTNHNQEAYYKLLEEISALIYSDGSVATTEAKLLNQLQLLDPKNHSPKSIIDKLLKIIQKLYRKAITEKV